MLHISLNNTDREILLVVRDAFLDSEIPETTPEIKEYNDQLLLRTVLKLSTEDGILSAEELRVVYVALLHFEHSASDLMQKNPELRAFGSELSVNLFKSNKLRKIFESVLEEAGLI